MTIVKLLSSPVDGAKLPASYNLGRCTAGLVYRENGGHGYNGHYAQVPGCEVAFAWKPAGLTGSVTCPACGGDLAITTRRLRQGFLVLSPADVKAIQDANGWTANRARIEAARKGQRNFATAGVAREREAWGGVKGVPTPVSVLEVVSAPRVPASPAPTPAAPAAPVADVKAAQQAVMDAFQVRGRINVEIARFFAAGGDNHGPEAEALRSRLRVAQGAVYEAEQAVRQARKSAKAQAGGPKGAAEAKLAKWDALPRCAWCLAYRPGKDTDLCPHCKEAVKWYGHKADQHDQGDRESRLRERARLVADVERFGGVAPACPFPARIPGLA
jgi:hypothetical protein